MIKTSGIGTNKKCNELHYSIVKLYSFENTVLDLEIYSIGNPCDFLGKSTKSGNTLVEKFSDMKILVLSIFLTWMVTLFQKFLYCIQFPFFIFHL